MAEAADARELDAAQAAERDPDFFPLNDLPNDVLVSVFEAVGDLRWARHTVPLVCKAWNELYLSENASPLHETLEVDFDKEVRRAVAAAAREGEGRRRGPVEGASPPFVIHASRVISWAQGRAGWVRQLRLEGQYGGNFEDFSSEELGALVAVVGPSLTDISVGCDLGHLYKKPFWDSLRSSVAPAGRLRSFVLEDIDYDSFGSDVETLLGQLAGSLEELSLQTRSRKNDEFPDPDVGLQRFPESLCALKKLRRLGVVGHPQITAIPAGLSSLKEIEELDLRNCGLSSLPKELGELSGLTRLDLSWNPDLGNTRPLAETFPAELGKMKSLRELDLRGCGLSDVPAFVCKLQSLESLILLENDLSLLPKELGELSGLTKLDLSLNRNLGTTLPADEAFPAELGKMKSLRELDLHSCSLGTVPSFVCKLKSLESLALWSNNLSSLPKELGELSGLTSLELWGNENVGTALPADEAFPSELGKMKSLRDLNLENCCLLTVPSFVGGLESLKSLDLCWNDLSSLPKELGELSGLTRLGLSQNENLGTARPADEAFPAELRKMKSLRYLFLDGCSLRTVPAFVGGLKSLKSLTLHFNVDAQIDAPLDFLIEGCPHLCDVRLSRQYGAEPWTPESRAHLEAFTAKLRARNPDADVSY